MFQREVAERIVADPGSKAYGRLGVLAGWRTEAHILFDVTPRAFTPPPKVVSSVVQLMPRERPLACDLFLLERVIAAAFGQRRKMLRQSLKTLGVDPHRCWREPASTKRAAPRRSTSRASSRSPMRLRLSRRRDGLRPR